MPVEEPPAPPRQKRDRSTARRLFKRQLETLLSNELCKAHFDRFIKMESLQCIIAVLVAVVLLVLSFIKSESGESAVCEDVRAIVTSLPSADTMVDAGRKKYMRVVPLCLPGADAKKGAVFFSLIQLVTVMLQECANVRALAIKKSEEWKTGELYGTVPSTYVDLDSGSAFRGNWEMCGRADASQANDLRIVVHGWTDEFVTVDGLGVCAKQHKYGVVLGSLVNLPLRVRHYVDNVLLIALYRAVYAKENGGLSRMLTGIGCDGVPHHDGVTMAAEVKVGKGEGTRIVLPDNSASSGEKEWCLRIFILLFSLDWLASGDFGPFAAAVSARRPCGKCLWTQACPCAFLPASIAKQDRFLGPDGKVVPHADACRRNLPRTHEGVMAVVREMRVWAGTKAQLRAHKTETGIFSPYFASEHILGDVVRDSSLDIMHLAFCGMSRYMLSWLTDILIPDDFSWATLNAAKRAHKFPKNVHIPSLERSQKDRRASGALRLNGNAAMHFTLAR
jgi:hypothetical protein